MIVLKEILYWGMWLIIPLLCELIVSLYTYIFLFFSKLKKQKDRYIEIEHKQLVSVLIPVYKSAKTLENCIESVANQTYGRSHIEVLLLNNGPRDESYEIFTKMQIKYKDMSIWWFDTHRGKAKALNEGIFNSHGQYIINIDSDGVMHKKAVENVIKNFLANPETLALTGVILTDYRLIDESTNNKLNLLRKVEFFEYAEAFLLGRNFASITGNIYTMAGAFSAFRREVLGKTFLYNTETVGEDTHMTFQVKSIIKNGYVKLCNNALFLVDPIENINKLYTQRQRWQRGQLEVGKLYLKEHTVKQRKLNLFTKPIMTLIFSHTLAFPRFIWMFGLIYLYMRDYPLIILVLTNVFMYLLYVINSFIGMLVYLRYLSDFKEIKRYVKKNWWVVFLLPLYRFVIYLFRLSGSINSRTRESSWNTLNINDEVNLVQSIIEEAKLKYIEPILKRVEKFISK